MRPVNFAKKGVYQPIGAAKAGRSNITFPGESFAAFVKGESTDYTDDPSVRRLPVRMSVKDGKMTLTFFSC